MKINFSVVSFVPSSAQVAVVGSVPELGSWNVDKCVQLEPSERPQSDMAPSFWYASLKVEGAKSIEYKFIRRRSQDVGWEWEGSGSGDNRKVDLVQEGEDVVQAASFGSILKGAQGKGGSEKVLAIPVTQFLDPAGVSEYSHTTRFYMNVKNQNSIHYNKIIEAMYVGTCPRCVEHLDMLKRDLGVTALFNLQTEEDALNNYPDPKSHPTMEGRTTDHVEEVAKRRGLAYVWMPTTDMSTQARARMLPQAALVMYGLLAGGHVVYCHCNAGVGESPDEMRREEERTEITAERVFDF
uniref:CBM20 domain-containing protein n=1 Tax=Chromera velia CCMP2878 TaxID=1169474 RepID=A0A0G4FKJ9_9ALVE|eukprot:Cvel_397.t1-p1 / transcript=Cvel_397.t1 / gene=Cvel_397 / organism=Chromera_velia_CCMP2878 / gene_product=Laforin, putative / transcript_product=Laforin, putative / location=Cvel_scaffold13:16443-20017(+) / protein_length=295 / sequence_SO=supercontig / SO=protein_coding / is_pseudo=false